MEQFSNDLLLLFPFLVSSLSSSSPLSQKKKAEEKAEEGMPQRGYVLIFVFWALLTLITPTLIFWSASEKSKLASSQGVARKEMKARRMMLLERGEEHLKNRTAPAPAPAPAPSPLPVMGNGTVW